MDGQMDGWMDGQTDGWMDGWTDRETRHIEARMHLEMENCLKLESGKKGGVAVPISRNPNDLKFGR